MLKIYKSIIDDEFWLSKNQLIYQTYIPFRKLQTLTTTNKQLNGIIGIVSYI